MSPRSALVLFLTVTTLFALTAPLYASKPTYLISEDKLTIEQAIEELTCNLEQVYQMIRKLQAAKNSTVEVVKFYNEWNNIKLNNLMQVAAMYKPDDQLPHVMLKRMMLDFRLKFIQLAIHNPRHLNLRPECFSYQTALAICQMYSNMVGAVESVGGNVTQAKAALDELRDVSMNGGLGNRLVAAMAKVKQAVMALPRVSDLITTTTPNSTTPLTTSSLMQPKRKLYKNPYVWTFGTLVAAFPVGYFIHKLQHPSLFEDVTEMTQALVSDNNLTEGFKDQASTTVATEGTRLWLVILVIMVLLAIVGVSSLWFFTKKENSIVVDKKTAPDTSQATSTSTSLTAKIDQI